MAICYGKKPTTFYGKNAGQGPEYVPTAYVFVIQNNAEDVGYMTASARSDWAPVLEYSKATPPVRQVSEVRSVAQKQGHTPTGRLLYHGGVKYGIELTNGQALNVRNGRPSNVGSGIDPASMSFDHVATERQWEVLSSDFASPEDESTTSNEVTAYSDWDRLHSVPAWTSHDETGANITNYGSARDAWADWDGCTPIAGSMIIAYYEGYTESDTWEREYIIDHLHDSMRTDDDSGETFPSNIDDGFDNYTEGSYSYDGRNIYNPDAGFTKREISDNYRPFLLNMTDGGSAEDRSQAYGDHSTTVVGYDDSGTTLKYELHDTWDDSIHYLTKGSWSDYWYTRVIKE